jgi:hypothetical protein
MFMRRVIFLGLLLLAAAGCTVPSTGRRMTSPSLTPPQPVDQADVVELWAVPPAAINWDEDPGPDGVRGQILLYSNRNAGAETVLVKGTLECLMYEGRVPRDGLPTARPQRTWTFTSQELATRQVRGMVGWGYAVQLGWGRQVPTSSSVTFAVRYTPASGPTIWSAPIVIAMPSRVRTAPVSSTIGQPPKPAALPREGELRLGRATRYPLKFRHELLDAHPPGEEHGITLLADVNNDGRLDVVIGCKKGEYNLFWYESPAWRRHDMAKAPGLDAGGAVLDVNGDGRPDIIAGQQLGGRELYWFECPADPTEPWPRHLIENRFQQYHDQAVGDVDGDGKPEIVFLSQQSGVLAYFKIPPDPKVEPWPKECCHVVATGLEGVEGLGVVDIDGDKKAEIIAGTAIYKRSASGEWQAEPLARGFKATRVAVADLDGDSRLEIVLAEGESNPGRLVWLKGPSWTPHRLRDDLFHPHTLQIADLNGDSLPDILVGEMGLGQNPNPRLIVYVNLGGGRFEENVISEGLPTHEAKVGDLKGDGRPAIVGKPYSPERQIDVWWNESGPLAPPAK